MEVKWFFIFVMCGIVSVCLMFSSNTYNATRAGLEECPKLGAGKGSDTIWVKSCKEYTEFIKKEK